MPSISKTVTSRPCPTNPRIYRNQQRTLTISVLKTFCVPQKAPRYTHARSSAPTTLPRMRTASTVYAVLTAAAVAVAQAADASDTEGVPAGAVLSTDGILTGVARSTESVLTGVTRETSETILTG
ncbi:hypothetical protein J3459_011055, partial [Metarhizium acridum]